MKCPARVVSLLFLLVTPAYSQLLTRPTTIYNFSDEKVYISIYGSTGFLCDRELTERKEHIPAHYEIRPRSSIRYGDDFRNERCFASTTSGLPVPASGVYFFDSVQAREDFDFLSGVDSIADAVTRLIPNKVVAKVAKLVWAIKNNLYPNEQAISGLIGAAEYPRGDATYVAFWGEEWIANYKSWKEFILPNYTTAKISSTIMLASHHGSISFFDDPNNEKQYYTKHIENIKPKLTVFSIGDSEELPDENAVNLYENYSTGYGNNRTKI